MSSFPVGVAGLEPGSGASVDVGVPPSNLSFGAIRRYAERVGRVHGIYDDVGHADIGRLLVALGGWVCAADSPVSLLVHGKGDFEVFATSFTSARRRRFAATHEVGHYFLHYRHPGREGRFAVRRGGRHLAEVQANVFAATLLMPEAEFRAAVGALGPDFWAVARRFDVSPRAAAVRAELLGLG